MSPLTVLVLLAAVCLTAMPLAASAADPPPPVPLFILATFSGPCSSSSSKTCVDIPGTLTFQDRAGTTGQGTFSFNVVSSLKHDEESGPTTAPFEGVVNATLADGSAFGVVFTTIPGADGIDAQVPFNAVMYAGAGAINVVTGTYADDTGVVTTNMQVVSGPSYTYGAGALSIALWPKV
ncbi:uncharacterized protein AMSG_06570 [Thecamonas trahens ATCC 50062]|uniref:Uncharacterized protein n=1 Tax=Thecamonas trahens ATCC 50062 TaxID=461836 RepID=A0A0L0DIR1_THETB|nr:hypothetical protein AMSG_06570 [Thecamonas trahens ATCC 50062]KNC51213.1 hypothetical protein AMSG_06570 [Thecamonas trahens ATCC 50062]|eukprot:XP_013756410.1 hypothetical protein AMSG_06570 [Thecamonas trahens ATCC 50062]